MKISLGFSPCPNDTFIFDALVHQRIDTEGLTFEYLLEDVETLNQWALEGKLDSTKISYFAYGHVSDKYVLMHSGSALGNNCGPLLIAREQIDTSNPDLKIAIPGRMTTANFLLSIAYPHLTNKIELVFSDIEQAVLDGRVDAGLIIHENRFTYSEKGLLKIRDLGEFWEETYQLPIPLGGICIRRNLPLAVQQKVQRLIRASVEYAFEHPRASESFVAAHAQEMQPAVRQAHINLYVNDFSKNLGPLGVQSVTNLYQTAESKGILKNLTHPVLLPNE